MGMLLIVGTFRLPAPNLAAARPSMRRMVEASRAEKGCLLYVYAEDLFEPGLIHVKEMWEDQAALCRHFETPHLGEWRATWDALGIGERALELYEVGEARAI